MPSLPLVKLTLPVAKLRGSATLFSNQVVPLDDALLDAGRTAFVQVEGLPGRVGVYAKTQLMAVRLLPAGFDAANLADSVRAHLSELRIKKTRLKVFTNSEAFRWVHGDADGLPGIVVDDYGALVVLQSSAHAGDTLLPVVTEALLPLVEGRPVFERSSGQTRQAAGLPERTRPLQGSVPTEVEAVCAGLRLKFAPLKAQKTGLFLDQSHNLMLFQSLARAVLPAKGSLLDVCCYAGAWSAAGASAGLASFTLVDQDASALARAKQNVLQNAESPLEEACVDCRHGDMFELLSVLGKEGKLFDVVVADPPAFAKSKKHVPEARRAYARMVRLAARLVRPGGMLVVCSCSRNLEETEFLELVGAQLQSSPETWSLALRGAQAPDHTVPAGENLAQYLKCAFYLKGGQA